MRSRTFLLQNLIASVQKFGWCTSNTILQVLREMVMYLEQVLSVAWFSLCPPLGLYLEQVLSVAWLTCAFPWGYVFWCYEHVRFTHHFLSSCVLAILELPWESDRAGSGLYSLYIFPLVGGRSWYPGVVPCWGGLSLVQIFGDSDLSGWR